MTRREPHDADDVLWSFIKRGFTVHYAGGSTTPSVIVLSYAWEHYVDIAHVRGIENRSGARTQRGQRKHFRAFACRVALLRGHC